MAPSIPSTAARWNNALSLHETLNVSGDRARPVDRSFNDLIATRLQQVVRTDDIYSVPLMGDRLRPSSAFIQGTSFEPNAILRGAQLTFVGAHRALQNPELFTSEHYRQAALAVVAGLVIRILVAIPTLGVRGLLALLGLFIDVTWDEEVVDGIHYVEHHVLQLPFFLMSFMRYLSPAMDHMFMDSLAWVDRTYIQKHVGESPDGLRAMYHENLKMYKDYHGDDAKVKAKIDKQGAYQAMGAFLRRFGRKATMSLALYLATFIPVVGRFVLPAASFFTFNKAVGTPAAVVIFGSGLALPKRYLVLFLQSYFSSRSLMRELLEPYFSRIHYTTAQKRTWFHSREGVLYGFALAFFTMLRIPLIGVLIYGIAEASTAYLITKITEPPPPPSDAKEFKENDVEWKNKHEFLALPYDKMDKFNIAAAVEKKLNPHDSGGHLKHRMFT